MNEERKSHGETAVYEVECSGDNENPMWVVRVHHGPYVAYHYVRQGAAWLCAILNEHRRLSEENRRLREALAEIAVFDSELFEDGVEADLNEVGITQPAEAFMKGWLDGIAATGAIAKRALNPPAP
jgi:hypothetical protein